MSRIFAHSPLDFRAMSPAIKFLIAANAAAFLLAQLAPTQFFDLFGLVPVHVWRDRWVWQPVTYLFLHGNFLHLLLNIFSLWIFALPVEAEWGPREFLKYYFLCGIGAGLLSLALSPQSAVPIIGASGAVYGLLVAFAMLYPDAVVYLYFLFPVKAKHMAVLFGLLEFFGGAAGSAPGIARFAHLGGMAIGYLYIRWWWIAGIQAKGLWHSLTRREGHTRARRAERPERGAPAQADAMEELDRILDKISAHGRGSLSPEELELLRKHSQRRTEGHA